MKGALSWLVPWACHAGRRDFCSAWAAPGRPSTNIFFLTVHYFNSFVPIAQEAGQAAVLGRLSLSICLWCQLKETGGQGMLYRVNARGTVFALKNGLIES
jgi:hypothetical protein